MRPFTGLLAAGGRSEGGSQSGRVTDLTGYGAGVGSDGLVVLGPRREADGAGLALLSFWQHQEKDKGSPHPVVFRSRPPFLQNKDGPGTARAINNVIRA